MRSGNSVVGGWLEWGMKSFGISALWRWRCRGCEGCLFNRRKLPVLAQTRWVWGIQIDGEERYMFVKLIINTCYGEMFFVKEMLRK